jgi:hypothetical protein
MGHLMAKEKKSMRRRLESSVGNASLLPRRRRITLMSMPCKLSGFDEARFGGAFARR